MIKKINPALFIIIILFSANNLFADTNASDKNKILTLEKQISEFESQLTENQKFFITHEILLNKMEDQLKADFNNKKKELENRFHELKNKHEKQMNLLYAFIILIPVLIAIGIFTAIKKFSEKYVIKILAKNFDVKTENLTHMLKEVKRDYILKQNKKILVVTPEDEDDEFLKRFFSDMSFPVHETSAAGGNVTFISFSEEQEPETGYDLVLFNDEESKTQQSAAEKYLKSYGTATVRLYFGPKHMYGEKDSIDITQKKKKLLTFTNARLQLYGNLMNALRFKI